MNNNVIKLEHLKLLTALKYLIITARVVNLIGGPCNGDRIEVKDFTSENIFIPYKSKKKVEYRFYNHTGYKYMHSLFRDTSILEVYKLKEVTHSSSINYIYIQVLEDWKYVE